MASLARKIADASRLQLVFLSVTWLAGIYVNGFVIIIPGTSASSILTTPPVEIHVIFASLSAATSVFILALAWANGKRPHLLLCLLASASMVLAGESGLAFVLGGASVSVQSMIMAVAFGTGMFLTFLSVLSLGGEARADEGAGRLLLSYAALLLFYLVFVSGMYVNLFVAGPVFSLPLGRELPAFLNAESSPPFLIHEGLGALLLATLVVLALAMTRSGSRASSAFGVVPAILVAYSAYVGSLNITAPPVPATSASVTLLSALVPMLSSAAFISAVVLTMLLALRLRGVSPS